MSGDTGRGNQPGAPRPLRDPFLQRRLQAEGVALGYPGVRRRHIRLAVNIQLILKRCPDHG